MTGDTDKAATEDAAVRQDAADSRRPLLAALRHVDELLGIAIARRHAALGADPFRGLHIAPEDVERWLGQSGAAASSQPQMIAAIEAALAAALQDRAFRWLADTYALTAFQAAVVFLSAASELDLRYERLFAYLQDDIGKKQLTVDLLLQLLCPDGENRAALRGEFTPAGVLVRHRLVSVLRAPDQPLLAASVQLDEQMLGLLLRETYLDPRLAAFCMLSTPATALDAIPLAEEWRRAIAGLVTQAPDQRQPLRLYLQGLPGTGKAQLAEAVATLLGKRLISADLAAAVRSGGEFRERLRLLFRESWLKDALLYLQGADVLREEDHSRQAALVDFLAADPGIVVLGGRKPWIATERGATGIVPLVFDMADPDVQRGSWRSALRGAGIVLADHDLGVLTERFRLTPAQAREAAAAAMNRCRWRAALGEAGPAAQPTLEDIFQAARAQCGYELASLARRIEPRRGWDDIVLPGESLAQLREICARLACHRRVLREWGFGQRLSLGKGVTVLFAGPSGTGKTLAAEIVAHDLGLHLYKIDLSSIVSKYIGETEKNLDRVFSAAQNANCVLLFDEADALFGKRSEVRDSHDRYANIEISYLLQKMEEFEGLAILATNLRQNIDEAFTRRLAFTVHFPFPDEAERRRIWSGIWPVALPLAADVDAGVLARELKMSGGNIKNTALAAAYYAAADGGVVTREHLQRAARREFQKMGKVMAATPPVAARAS